METRYIPPVVESLVKEYVVWVKTAIVPFGFGIAGLDRGELMRSFGVKDEDTKAAMSKGRKRSFIDGNGDLIEIDETAVRGEGDVTQC
jgi:hypothetical protein